MNTIVSYDRRSVSFLSVAAVSSVATIASFAFVSDAVYALESIAVFLIHCVCLYDEYRRRNRPEHYLKLYKAIGFNCGIWFVNSVACVAVAFF